MLSLVLGGAASGKSEFAEGLILAAPAVPRLYLATMAVWDGEDARRVERHRALRAGKGFTTLEFQLAEDVPQLPLGCAALLEDLPNLVMNECFGPSGAPGTEERVLAALTALEAHAGLLVVVSGVLDADGVSYPAGTADYLRRLEALHRALARRADRVYEVVCGIALCVKGEGT